MKKGTRLSIVILCIVTGVFAQNVDFTIKVANDGKVHTNNSTVIDKEGNIFVAGGTRDGLQVTDNAFQNQYNGDSGGRAGGDIYFMKISPDGEMLYSTYIGGSQDEYYCNQIAIDQEDNVYVGFTTDSTDLPISENAYQKSNNGENDHYIIKFSNDCEYLASTYLGGSGSDHWTRLGVNDNILYVVACTKSEDFPITQDAVQTQYNSWGGTEEDKRWMEKDITVTAMSLNLDEIYASTYVGGNNYENVNALCFDEAGRIILAGNTKSPDFPTSTSCYDDSYGGNYDGFVTIVNPTLSTIEYSTFIGTDKSDQIQSMVSVAGQVILVGDTQSADFPTTSNAMQPNLNGTQDGIILKLDVTNNTLRYSSFIGGSGGDSIKDIEHSDPHSYTLVVRTGSTDFPVSQDAPDKNLIGGSDLAIVALDENLETIQHATYLGGSKHEYMAKTSSDGAGSLILTFTSTSDDIPATITYAEKDSTNMNVMVKFDMTRTVETDSGWQASQSEIEATSQSALETSSSHTIVWKEVTSLPEGYYLGDAVTLGDEIYFVAGRTTEAKVPFFFKFSPEQNKWTRLADIPQATFNIALAAVNGRIYAIGGDLFQDANRQYNPQTDTWTIVAPMPTGRQHIDCGVYEDEIFVMGGLTSWKNITRTHEAYNVTSNSWSEKTAIPSLRNNAAVVTMDSLIYVIGGAGTKDNIWGDIWTVETYNVKTNIWEQKNNLPFLLFKPAATVVNGELFVLGGQTRIDGIDDCSDKVLIYNSDTDTWEETTPLPAKNVFFGCVSIDQKMYVIGGTVGGNPNWAAYSAVYVGEVVSNKGGHR